MKDKINEVAQLLYTQDEIYSTIKKFIIDYEIGHAEVIYQCDEVQLALHELVEKICELVGYYKEK